MNSSGESAAREQWMLDAAEEIADAFIDDGLKEATATVSADIIARHYAAREREEWIPVSERLPEYGTVSVVYCHDVGEPENPWQDMATYSYHGGWCVGSDKHADRIVTHWRPLPAAPFAAKGETE